MDTLAKELGIMSFLAKVAPHPEPVSELADQSQVSIDHLMKPTIGISKKEFIREYSNALLEGSAAIFAGAGLSIPAGFVNWKELLRQVAEDLELDIEKEHDLIALAQYEANRKGNRDSLNNTIIREFCRNAQLTKITQ